MLKDFQKVKSSKVCHINISVNTTVFDKQNCLRKYNFKQTFPGTAATAAERITHILLGQSRKQTFFVWNVSLSIYNVQSTLWIQSF